MQNASPILDKIRKLLSLAKSDNEHEAAAAAAAAQRLMTEHDISEAELPAPSEPAETPSLDMLTTFGSVVPAWLGGLAAGLSKLQHCKCWSSRGPDGAWRLSIVGTPSDVATVRYLYAWLHSEIERHAQKYARGGGRSYADSYRKGCVSGALEAMALAVREVRATATGNALVKIDARAAASAAYVEESLGISLRKKSSARIKDGDAYGRGRQHGAHMGQRNAQLAATGTRMLGGKS